MLVQTLLRRSARVLCAASTVAEGFVAPLGMLHFADRAVKTTSSSPQFICLHGLLATQSPHCNGLVTAVQCGPAPSSATYHSGGRGAPVNEGGDEVTPRLVSELDDCGWIQVRVQLHGDCAACVFRGPQVTFQCRGDDTPQTHEFALSSSDVVALVSDVSKSEALDRLFAKLGLALQQQCDLEYAAEELLLALTAGRQGGSTALLGKVSTVSSSTSEPPHSSQSIC